MSEERAPIKVFIDTNVYLDFYRLSNADLTKLEQLVELSKKTGDIELYVTQHQVDEFYRNREAVIAESLNQARNNISLPPIYSGHNSYETVKADVKLMNQRITSIHQDTLREAKDGTLKADKLVEELFANTKVVDDEIYQAASKRSKLGNPPGKPNSIGDAINWEVLLREVEENSTIHIISQDGDFSSPLVKGKIDSFLRKEWEQKKKGTVILYESLNSFFKTNLDDIKLLDEYVKERLIVNLANSKNFDEARKIIRNMYLDKSFTLKQTEAIIKAATEAVQVFRANEYSPSIVGERLRDIIAPHWNDVDIDLQLKWNEVYPNAQLDIQIPF